MRRVLALSVALLMAVIVAPEGAVAAKKYRFPYGVAAGDATTNSVLLWTRGSKAGKVTAQVSLNRKFTKIVKQAGKRAKAGSDFTVEVNVGGLKPGKSYFYRFLGPNGERSAVGQFQTAPTGSDVEFVWAGDSDGTKNAAGDQRGNVASVAQSIKAENADFFGYLGDTIYADSSLGSAPATTLAQYRNKYKEARTIGALKSLLGSTSVIANWDDHEVANDYATNPPSATDNALVPILPFDPARITNGQRAFREYFPLRESATLGNYRVLRWGNDLDVFVLDERSFRDSPIGDPLGGSPGPYLACLQDTDGDGEGDEPDFAPTLPQPVRQQFVGIRDYFAGPPPAGCLDLLRAPNRTMLGDAQKAQFKADLMASDATFKVILNEVAIQQFYAFPYDRWEGYEAERHEIIDFIADNEISGIFWATTDQEATLGNQVCRETLDSTTAAYTCDEEASTWELVSGPMGAATYGQLLDGFGGAGTALQVGAFMTAVLQVDCVNLNQISYGKVDVDASAGTLTANSYSPATGGGAPICSSDIVVTG